MTYRQLKKLICEERIDSTFAQEYPKHDMNIRKELYDLETSFYTAMLSLSGLDDDISKLLSDARKNVHQARKMYYERIGMDIPHDEDNY